MPGYVRAALIRFQHTLPPKLCDAPSKWTVPIFGAKKQYALAPDNSPILSAKTINLVQQIVGTFLYYGIAVDNTLLLSLSDLSVEQSAGTEKTWNKIIWLLNYVASHPDASIRYVASNMILHVHSNASYLSAPRARSRAGGHFTLGFTPGSTPTEATFLTAPFTPSA